MASGSSLCRGLSASKEYTNAPSRLPLPCCCFFFSYKSPRFHLAPLASLRGPVTAHTRGDSPQALAFGLAPPLHHPWMHTSPPPPPGPCCTWHRNPSRWHEGALTLIWKVSIAPPTNRNRSILELSALPLTFLEPRETLLQERSIALIRGGLQQVMRGGCSGDSPGTS